MKKLIYITLLVLFTTNAYATEAFVAECESDGAHRYDNGNGLDMMGDKIPNPDYGWTTENWWGKDKITWDGGKEIFLNYGKISAIILGINNNVIQAVYTNMNNVYVVTFDVETGIAILSQQQTVVMGKHRRVMSRTTSLKCNINDKK